MCVHICVCVLCCEISCINFNPLCRRADFQGAPTETLLPQQRHRRGRLDRKYYPGAEQQHGAGDGGGARAAQHCAALSGSHGWNVFHRLLPTQVQEQCVLPREGEELNSLSVLQNEPLYIITHIFN